MKKENRIKDWQQPDGIQHSVSTTGKWQPDDFLGNRTPGERKADSKIKAETITSEPTLKQKIMSLLYLDQPSDKERKEVADKILKLFRKAAIEILENILKMTDFYATDVDDYKREIKEELEILKDENEQRKLDRN